MNNKYGYHKSIEICEQALDMLDVKYFLQSGKSVNSIMDELEAYIYNFVAENEDANKVFSFMLEYPEIFCDDPPELFNYMTDDEFLNYCKKRFPEIKWMYECIERYWVQ